MEYIAKGARFGFQFSTLGRECVLRIKDKAYVQMKLITASVREKFENGVENKDKGPEHLLSWALRKKHLVSSEGD